MDAILWRIEVESPLAVPRALKCTLHANNVVPARKEDEDVAIIGFLQDMRDGKSDQGVWQLEIIVRLLEGGSS